MGHLLSESRHEMDCGDSRGLYLAVLRCGDEMSLSMRSACVKLS